MLYTRTHKSARASTHTQNRVIKQQDIRLTNVEVLPQFSPKQWYSWVESECFFDDHVQILHLLNGAVRW